MTVKGDEDDEEGGPARSQDEVVTGPDQVWSDDLVSELISWQKFA